MLRFQLVRRKHLFLLELLFVSTVLHCVAFFFLFVFYSGYRYSAKIVVRRSGVQIVPTFFMDRLNNLQKSETVKNQSGTNSDTNQKISAKKVLPSTTIQKMEQKKKDSSVQKKEQKNPSPSKKQQTTQKQKEEPKKKLVQKNQQKNQQHKQQAKQQMQQKKQTVKEKTVQKKDTVKQEEQKIEKKVADNAEIDAPSAVQSVLPLAVHDAVITGIDDSDTIQIQNYVQREVSRIWYPPLGLPEDIVCYVKVQIGSDGAVVETEIEESSGVLVYDLSARSAATCLSLPRWAWGREFTISFRYE